jgi:hypothetical protein
MRIQKYTKAVSIYLTEEVYQEIKTITDKDQISIGEWIRYAINIVLAAEERGA